MKFLLLRIGKIICAAGIIIILLLLAALALLEQSTP